MALYLKGQVEADFLDYGLRFGVRDGEAEPGGGDGGEADDAPMADGGKAVALFFFASIIPVFNGKGHDKPASPVIVGIQLKAAAKQDYVTFCQRKSYTQAF